MKKNTAEAVANEMAAQGYKPILAHATRDTGIKTWEVWGTDPDTLASVMVATREEWDQHVSDKAHANAVDYCAEHFTGAVSVLAVELADAIKRAEAAEAKLAAVPRKSIEALFFQQFGESPIWFDKRWDPIAEWLGLE
jgi:hypothetical protein